MRQRSDAVTGLILAFVGIALLMAWRSGALDVLMRGDLFAGARSSVPRAATGLRDAADTLGNSAPAISTRSPQGPGSVVAASGTPEDGLSSTIAPVIADPWGPGGFLDESSRAARRAAGGIYTSIDETIRARAQTLEYKLRPLVTDAAAASIDSSSLPVAGGNFLVP